MTKQKEKLLEIRDLLIEFKKGKKTLKAVKGISFDIYKGETFGLVGESGSGKTTIGKAIMGIQPLTDGTVYFNNQLVRGKTPSLFHISHKISDYMNVMYQNQIDTTKILDNYLNDFKKAYNKFVPIDQKNDSDRLTIERLRPVKIKTKQKTKAVDIAIENNLKWLIKIIHLLQKTRTFLTDLNNNVDINQPMLGGINKYVEKVYSNTLTIKQIENKIHDQLDEIGKINDEANEEKYSCLTSYMNDIAACLKEIIKYHKSIATFIKIIQTDVQNVIWLTTPKIKRNVAIKQVEKLKENNKQQNNDLIVQQYDEILNLLSLPPIDDEIHKSKIYKKTSRKENHNLKQKMQMIFQDPASSLNNRMQVEQIIGEGLSNFPEIYKSKEAFDSYLAYVNKDKSIENKIDKKDIRTKDVKRFLVEQMLLAVGMLPEHLNRYPHEFSGGQRQRIGIARSLVMKPEFIIADEPISSLDVSIRAQILNLLIKFQERYDLTYIFIAHDLTVVRFIANRIGVIYHGDLVEMADADELFTNPLHPYTKSLLNAIPIPNPEKENKKRSIKYDPKKEHADYLIDFPMWTEIKPGHYVYLNTRELNEIKK